MEMASIHPHPTDFLDLPPADRLYTCNTIALTMLFTGIFGATYMVAKNFIRVGEPHKVKYAVLGAVGVLGLTLGADHIPILAPVPDLLLNLAFAVITFICVKIWQQKKIDRHVALGGALEKRGTVLLVNLVGFLCLVLLVAGVLIVEDPTSFMDAIR
jgi:hypothetical protein